MWECSPTLSFHNSFSITNNDALVHLQQRGICRHKTTLETHIIFIIGWISSATEAITSMLNPALTPISQNSRSHSRSCFSSKSKTWLAKGQQKLLECTPPSPLLWPTCRHPLPFQMTLQNSCIGIRNRCTLSHERGTVWPCSALRYLHQRLQGVSWSRYPGKAAGGH